MMDNEKDADLMAKLNKDAAHQEEINRLNEIIQDGGKLDEIEEEQGGIQVRKAHDDLVVTHDTNSDLLRMKMKDVVFPLSDVVKKDLQKLEDLYNELVDAKMAVGLAAQQANVSIRVCCVKIGSENITMINPHIIARKGKKRAYESCLSIPAVAVEIMRPRNITVEYYDKEGERHLLSPMLHKHCRRICHEVEHLDGILIDRYIKPDNSNVHFYLPEWADQPQTTRSLGEDPEPGSPEIDGEMGK